MLHVARKHASHLLVPEANRRTKLMIDPCTTACSVRDLIVTSWRKETRYTVLLHGTEFDEGNQGEKMQSDTIEVSNNFIS